MMAGISSSYAQRSLGVSWEVPKNPTKALQQLNQFNKAGISFLEIQSPVDDTVRASIKQIGFTVYGNLDIRYPLSNTFAKSDSVLVNKIQHQTSLLLKNSSTAALGLFSYGPASRQNFQKAIHPFIKQIKKADSLSVYGHLSFWQPVPKSDNGADFYIRDLTITKRNFKDFSIAPDPNIHAYRYRPASLIAYSLAAFKKVVTESTAQPSKPLFVNGSWLLSMLDRYSQLKPALQTLSKQNRVILPLPDKPSPSTGNPVIPIILLLVIWGSWGLHYNISPVYRKSLLRYFTAHTFFVNDVIKRHFRSPAPAIILLLQNGLAISATGFVALQTIFTKQGLLALFYHLPGLSVLGEHFISMALALFLTSILLSTISILWIFLGNKKRCSFTQLATFYAWPLHLNLILASLVIILHASGSAYILIASLSIVVLLVQISSFFITSFDAIQFNIHDHLGYLGVTSGVFLSLIVATCIALLSNTQLLELISLATNL